MPTVALHGNYYDNNFGDLLLLKVFERWVRSAHDCRIVYPLVPPAERARFAAQFPDSPLGDGRARWDALIYCGGGLFADAGTDGRFLPGYFARRFFREYVAPAERCIWTRRPYAIIGAGAGPLSNLFVRFEAGRIFRHAAAVSVRDEESRCYVADQLSARASIEVAPDPAVTVSRADIPADAAAAVERLVAPVGDRLLLGVHHPRDYLLGSPPSNAMRAALVTALRANPHVVPVLFSDIGTQSSLVHLRELAGMLRDQTARECLTVPYTHVWQTVALIARMSAVLTTKLHVGIVSYAVGVYVESFALHPKTLRFYQLTGRPQQSQLFHDLDQASAAAKIARALEVGARRPLLTDATWERVRRDAGLHGRVVARFLDQALGAAPRRASTPVANTDPAVPTTGH